MTPDKLHTIATSLFATGLASMSLEHWQAAAVIANALAIIFSAVAASRASGAKRGRRTVKNNHG